MTSTGPQGRLGRRLLPAAALVPPLLGAAHFALTSWGWLGAGTASLLLVLLMTALVAGLVVALRRLLRLQEEQQRQQAQEREKLMGHLHKTVTEVTRLQTEMVTVCAWTRRIKDENRWVSFEEFLRTHLGIEVTHGISDEARAQLEQAGRREGRGVR